MRKIHSIDNTGKIKFIDDKGTGTTFGNEADCKAYGYQYVNGVCRVPASKQETSRENNFINGNGNIVNGVSNSVLGNNNTLRSNNSVAIGKGHYIDKTALYSTAIGLNAYAENYGEISFSSAKVPNRAKFSFYQFDGVTTNNTATELYLGGFIGARLYINPNYTSGYAIDYSSIGLNINTGDVFTSYGHATYKNSGSTLTEVGHEKSTIIRDSSANHYDIEFAPISGTPDYIEVKVKGDTGHTVYWTVDLKVTEVRYG